MPRALALLVLTAACNTGPAPARADDVPPSMSHAKATAGATKAETPAEPPSCVDDGKPFDEAALKTRLAALAAKELDGRAPGTAGDRAARTLIAERFRCLGLTPAGDKGGFEQAFVYNKITTANVVAVLPGGDPDLADQIILVGAHHDHLGGGYLGANDNASGVVALLAVAQSIRQRATKPPRTIAFVTFGAEEAGLVGSTYFLAHPPAAVPLDRVVQLINLDMLGSYSSKNAVHAFGTFPKLPARKELEAAAKLHPTLYVGMGGHSVRGDHHGFCTKNIPYVFFWTPDKRCYHEKCDTADAIDYPNLAKISAIAGSLVERLADTDVDLAASRTKLGCRAR